MTAILQTVNAKGQPINRRKLDDISDAKVSYFDLSNLSNAWTSIASPKQFTNSADHTKRTPDAPSSIPTACISSVPSP